MFLLKILFQVRVFEVEISGILVRLGDSESFGLLEEIADKADACGASVLSEPIGDTDSRVAGEIGEKEVAASGGSDVDIYSFHFLCHLLHEKCPDTVGLDVFHSRDEP